MIVFMRGSRGGDRGPDHRPLEIHKNIVFLGKLVWIPWKITKLLSQHSLFGYHRPASKTPFKWRFAGGPIIARFQCYSDPLSSPHQLKTQQQNVRVGLPLTKRFGSVHGVLLLPFLFIPRKAWYCVTIATLTFRVMI